MKSRVRSRGWYILILILHAGFITNGFSENITVQEQGKQQFFTYCSSCHTLRYTGYTTVNTLSTETERWFGKSPPDLSNVARVRGPNWLKSFLKGFYPDTSSMFGSNNHQLKNVSMPNVLASISQAACRDQVVDDIVAYLSAVAEPTRDVRQKIGVYVVSFLAVFACAWFVFMKYCKT